MTNGAQGVSSQQFIDSQNKLRAAKLKLLRAKLTIDEDNYYDALEPEEKAEPGSYQLFASIRTYRK